ncbi:MAG TPA: hypothetical protein VNR66_15490 [Solirubrobacteraceae bacterium]|nr:hypothetical protein [Solirubrobacteraceae bacterium]
MLDSGLLISWGEASFSWGEASSRRQEEALRLFSEVVAYHDKLLEEGHISGFEPFLLGAHGGGPRRLGGFMIVRGTPGQISTLRHDDEFRGYVHRAEMLMNDVGVEPVYLGEALRHMVEPLSTRSARSRSLA